MKLEAEKYVIAVEVGHGTQSRLQLVIDDVYDRIKALKDELTLAEMERNFE